jgi:aminoglycoside phosphotransferase (APT) family kinase protein
MARVDWGQLPAELRGWVVAALGGRVAEARSQAGGFSPGAACRLRLEDGRRAFCKAVSASANPESPVMHRREAQIAAALPPDVPAPRFIASYDDGEWVGLLFADVDGRPPAQPWRADELDQVLGAIAVLHDRLTPSPLSSVPVIADMHAANFTGWRSLAADSGASARPLPGVRPWQDPWSRRHLHRLAELEAGWPEAAAGNTLLHDDLRADNMLITADGVRFVDWPHACAGVAWFDVAAFAPTAVVAAVAGYFTYQATLPPPPGLPAIREFQEAQGAPARAWLQRLTGWK